ncbi:thiamine-monophosphate kinase [Roseibium aquae]|uniref:Thiamine-monophosphate kinase n=1 Tax=Roseibium aquae TaxID=1323746 RepID=A0A916TLQ4_9HYPH|nr:thiamine-phosphate kinase [Roseibium aquae]GGB56611.1 thiamine-monophosphate kinase [Roseibium aquae]
MSEDPARDGNGGRPGEFDLIKTYFAPLAGDPGSLGLTDDAAVLTPVPGSDLVLTKDVLAADRHFFADDPPEAIAAKALRVNLSDLAAKGASPRGYLLGLALPQDWTEDWLVRFTRGLAADQAAYDITLLGGDTICSGDGLQISITAIGEVPNGKAVRRSGAKPGDILFITGTVGDAAAGLKVLLDKSFSAESGLSLHDERHVIDRYLLPRPRMALTGALRARATAALDVSDGLIADAGHMAVASGVDLVIDLARVPVSPALRQLRANSPKAFAACLNGGDDYEILSFVPADQADGFVAEAARAGCPVTPIGRAEQGSGAVRFENADELSGHLQGPGFRHF